MRFKNYIIESFGTPKKGDEFVDKKGKKATVVYVGSGMGNDKYIEIKYENEKNTKDIKIIDFFNNFKYLNKK